MHFKFEAHDIIEPPEQWDILLYFYMGKRPSVIVAQGVVPASDRYYGSRRSERCLGARFSKVPKTFRARIAICEPTNRLFWNADLLTCFQGSSKQTDCEI